MKNYASYDRAFSEAYEKTKAYKLQSWFPRLASIQNEGSYYSLVFKLASGNPMDSAELEAIKAALGADSVSSDGIDTWGCDTCGHGSSQVVDVKGWSGQLPSQPS